MWPFHDWRFNANRGFYSCSKCRAIREPGDKERRYLPNDGESPHEFERRCRRAKHRLYRRVKQMRDDKQRGAYGPRRD